MHVIVVLALLVGALLVLGSKRLSSGGSMSAAGTASGVTMPVEAEPVVDPGIEVSGEIQPRAFVVRHLRQGMATLMLRHRPTKNGCTAHLIIWSGKKKARIQDSYFDLGLIQADGVKDGVVDEFIARAMTQIDALASAGKQKRSKAKLGEIAEKVPALPTVATGDATVAPQVAVVTEQNEMPDPAIQLKRFPSIFRGQILEFGMMPRILDDGEKQMFGVRYKTAEGVEDTVWGADLRTKIRAANARIGDHVEILKIGRKTVEAGKAPMSLYQITRLDA